MHVETDQVRDIFLAALKVPPAQRPAYLQEACAGAEPLRQQIERLLQAHLELGSIPEPSARMPGATIDEPPTERPGTVIGPYKLLQQIGEGGMGVVFMAEQTEPVKRKVALKIIKPGMDSRQVIARFEAERQALAMMDHVNIARVFDGGTTETGRPYFVMELVHGVPITKYCDDNHLTPRERLELFVPVCQAIQHAHQKGIIHRDIKPSNVMVTLYDGKPVPKVIDFGVAKATEQKLTERTLFTQYGTMVGTLEYMSPEQAEMSALGVDTRSDIYSLGVLLYELLTGSTPLTHKRMKEAAYAEILRMIKEEEPPKPSTRLSDSGEALASISANRHTEPAKLTKLVRGELDWIVMKTLEKDRNRRYETANGFAADVQRYLNDEPVQACPPSAIYRLKKLVRRNKGPVVAVGIVLLTLVGGIVGTTVGLVRANQAVGEERIAKLDAEEQKANAIRSAVLEAEERKNAQAKVAEANAVIQFFEKKVFSAGRPKGQDGGLGSKVSLRDAVVASLPALNTAFVQQPLVEARLRETLGLTFAYLGEAERACAQFERARELYTRHLGHEDPATLGNMVNLANCYVDLDRFQDALKLYEETLAIRKRVLPPDHPDTLRSMAGLAQIYGVLNRIPEALKLYEETLPIMKRVLPPDDTDTLGSTNNLANCYYALNRIQDALKLYEETLAIRKRVLPADHPETLGSMNNLANIYSKVNRHQDALKLHEETLAIKKRVLPADHPETLNSMNNLADSYADLNRHPDALKLREETLAIRKRVLTPDHPDTLRSMGALADSLLALNRGAEAIPFLDEFLAKAPGRPDIHPAQIRRATNLRLQHFQKVGDPAGCRATAAMWEKLNRPDAESLYNAACYRAVTAAVQAKTPGANSARLANADADKAMELLRQAVKAGWNDVAHMKEDDDLKVLRDREEFKKLLAELEAKKK